MIIKKTKFFTNREDIDDGSGPQYSSVPEKIILSGRITRIENVNDFAYQISIFSESGFTTIKGLSRTELKVGCEILAYDCFKIQDKVGSYYVSSHIIMAPPKYINQVAGYFKREFPLLSSKGAAALIYHFKEDFLDIIGKNPDALSATPGLSAEDLDHLINYRNYNNLIARISSICTSASFPQEAIFSIVQKFGLDAENILNQNPFLLSQIKSISSDAILNFAEGKNLSENAKDRLTFEIETELSRSLSNGNTCIELSKMLDSIASKGQFSELEIKNTIDLLLHKIPSPIKLRIIDDVIYLSYSKVAKIENRIAKNIARIIKGSSSLDILAQKAVESSRFLNDENQIQAIKTSFLSGVSVITGGPGVGKSTILEKIVRTSIDNGLTVSTCALSNSAARRISQVTKEPSSTLHSTLGVIFEGVFSETNNFEFNSSNPLPSNVFAVDEFTMNDIYLCDAFFEAVPTGSRVVLLGDVGQIPSVGPGNVLRDIINSKIVPVTYLTKTHRTNKNSDINAAADAIRFGNYNEINFHGDRDFQFTQAKSGTLVLHYAVEAYKKLSEKFKSVQILASLYGTDAGIDIINEKIQSIINPYIGDENQIEYNNKIWRVGDKVLSSSKRPGLIKTCGEIGIIKEIIWSEAGNANKKNDVIRIDFEGEIFELNKGDLGRDIIHAYAISIHKSQGLEFPAVICIASPQHATMLNGNLLLTGFTRARQHMEVIGDKQTIITAAKIDGNTRVTGLVHEMSKEVNLINNIESKQPLKRAGMR